MSLVLCPASSRHFGLPGLSTVSFTQGVFPALPGFLSSKQPSEICLMATNWITYKVQLICFLCLRDHWFSLLMSNVIKPLSNSYIFSDFLLLLCGRLDLTQLLLTRSRSLDDSVFMKLVCDRTNQSDINLGKSAYEWGLTEKTWAIIVVT